jgi:hypothetical protein
MRKATIAFFAALGLMAVAAGPAAATPTVKFKATAVPITGFRHTGNIYGAGAAVDAEYAINGNEYYGGPAPLKHVNVWLPSGSKIHSKGFKTCSLSLIAVQHNPKACASASHAGPTGSVKGTVKLEETCTEVKEAYGAGAEVEACEAAVAKSGHFFRGISENATITPYYVPGGIEFFTKGVSPVLIEIPSHGTFTNPNGGGPTGPEFHGSVPEVESLPGAPYASVDTISVKTGSAYKKGRKDYYYGTMPTKCPKHYLPVKTQLTFYAVENELGQMVPESTVTTEYHAPCPKR